MPSETVQTVVATLRVIAEQAERESDRQWLLEIADSADGPLNDAVCPLCQEVTCDDGCPLRRDRAIAMQPPPPRLSLEAFNATVQEQHAMIFQNAAHTQYGVAIPCPQCKQTTQWVEGQIRGMDRNTYRMQPCGHEVPSDARQLEVDENGYLKVKDIEA